MYKRQVRYNVDTYLAGENEKRGKHMKRKNQMLAVLLTAVLSTGCLAACGNKQDSGSDTPVSYTHLDVYKRQR